jgi:hypothetical protein
VQYSPYTGVCLLDLSRLLTLYASRKIKIGSFSAASNVTGVLTATNDVSILMHRANGWAFFDYASAAPYIDVRIYYYCWYYLLVLFVFIHLSSTPLHCILSFLTSPPSSSFHFSLLISHAVLFSYCSHSLLISSLLLSVSFLLSSLPEF